MKSMTWKKFEKRVLEIASYIWDSPSGPERINGVAFDCVIKTKADLWVIIEATENMTLNKVREDIGKFAACRLSVISQNIYPDCYLVMNGKPTSAMKEAGKENHIKVLSFSDFSSLFLDHQAYYHKRLQIPFGSSVDPVSGSPDQKQYTPVQYEYYSNGKHLTLKEITSKLLDGKKVVVLGKFGTGKSRCVREVFLELIQSQHRKLTYPISINLKENWGVKRAEELIRRHFFNLGLDTMSNSVLKILNKSSLFMLLDGFDEIGTQIWSDNPDKLKQIRAESLVGVKDLIQKVNGAILITGREQYFNSLDEMLSALGLDLGETILVKCRDEFTEEEMRHYMKSLSNVVDFPYWLPRKPLICQIINSLAVDVLERMFVEADNEVSFWNTLVLRLAEREARINPALDKNTILETFKEIALTTRKKPGNVGPLSIHEINAAFEVVVGTPPADESAVMLQRLPALGRIKAESRDRQFIDEHILDGFRAENLVDIVTFRKTQFCSQHWVNPLDLFGIHIISQAMGHRGAASHFFTYLREAIDHGNSILAGDLLAAFIVFGEETPFDLDGIELVNSHIKHVNLADSKTHNFTISDSIIEYLDVTNCHPDDIGIRGCEVRSLFGVASDKGLPDWLVDNRYEKFETVNTISRIKSSKLCPAHRILVAIIKKTFFQPGSGRKEEALLRGFGNAADKKLADKIINKLLRERVIGAIKGKEGTVYVPKRHHTKRMDDILTKLSLSKDLLWLDIGDF